MLTFFINLAQIMSEITKSIEYIFEDNYITLNFPILIMVGFI